MTADYIIGDIKYKLFVKDTNVLILYSLVNGHPLIVFELKSLKGIGKVDKIKSAEMKPYDYKGVVDVGGEDDKEFCVIVATTMLSDANAIIKIDGVYKMFAVGLTCLEFQREIIEGTIYKIVVKSDHTLYKSTAWKSDRSFYTWNLREAAMRPLLEEAKSLNSSPVKKMVTGSTARRCSGLGVSPVRNLVSEEKDFVVAERRHPSIVIVAGESLLDKYIPSDTTTIPVTPRGTVNPRLIKVDRKNKTSVRIKMESGLVKPLAITNEIYEGLYEEIRQLHPVLTRNRRLSAGDLAPSPIDCMPDQTDDDI